MASMRSLLLGTGTAMLLMTAGTLQGCGDKAEAEEPAARVPEDVEGAAPAMHKVDLVDAVGDENATCNDGSPGVYYWAPAPPGGDPRTWFVYLQGGGWCYDAATCARRGGNLVSTSELPDVQDVLDYGIFGTKSPLYKTNRVDLRYCSSDAWMGDVGADESLIGVNARGARILRAALRHLVEVRGLADGDTLFFGGASAGARGAMVHLDTLKAFGLVPSGVRIFGILDSPMWLDLPAFGNLTTAANRLPTQTKEVVRILRNEELLAGAGACALAEPWKCAFAHYRIPLLKTPFFMYASQYDQYFLTKTTSATVKKDSCFPEPQCSYYEYADRFASAMREQAAQLPQVLAGTAGIYMSTCYNHMMTPWEAFNAQTVNDVTMAEALEQALEAYLGGEAPPVLVDETCSAFNCGQGCQLHLNSSCGCDPMLV